MGSYFSNLHVRKDGVSDADVKSSITKHFLGAGYTVAESEDADLNIDIYTPEESGWISVYSDSFAHTDVMSLSKAISAKIDSDILSIACFDSDYLFMHLRNAKRNLDLWLNIGESYDFPKLRRSNLLGWKSSVKDFATFRRLAKQSYVCAEDFLMEAAVNLDLPYGQSTEFDRESTDKKIEKLYFAAPKNEDLGSTKLRIMQFSLTPCTPGQRTGCFVENEGSASRGIRVLFIGDYVESGDITIEDTAFVYHGADGEPVETPISFEKVKRGDGSFAYLWEDKDFNIPEAPSSALPPRAKQEEEFRRSFGIRYTPKGNKRKFLDICIIFLPIGDSKGKYCWWRVWGCYESKSEYIEYTNNEEREWGKILGREPKLIDPDEYDLN